MHSPGELDRATLKLLVADDAVEKIMHDLRSLAALGLLTTTVDPSGTRRYIVNTIVVVEDPKPLQSAVKQEGGVRTGQATDNIVCTDEYQGTACHGWACVWLMDGCTCG